MFVNDQLTEVYSPSECEIIEFVCILSVHLIADVDIVSNAARYDLFSRPCFILQRVMSLLFV